MLDALADHPTTTGLFAIAAAILVASLQPAALLQSFVRLLRRLLDRRQKQVRYKRVRNISAASARLGPPPEEFPELRLEKESMFSSLRQRRTFAFSAPAVDSLLDIIVDFGFPGRAPAAAIALATTAIDDAFRAFCREEGLPFDGLELIASGPGSWFCRFRPRPPADEDGNPVPIDYNERNWYLAIASFVAMLGIAAHQSASGPSPGEIGREVAQALEEVRRQGARDVAISGPKHLCYAPPMGSPEGAPERSFMAQLNVRAEQAGGVWTARTSFCDRPLPIYDLRVKPWNLRHGGRYQVTARVVADASGTILAVQLYDVATLDDVED